MHEWAKQEPFRIQYDHIVQFYEDDVFLHGVVTDFLVSGIESAQPLVVIATAPNRDAFVERLGTRGHDVESLRQQGRLTLLDARETLATFMTDGVPDRELFFQTVGAVLAAAEAGRQDVTIRAYGEMVDVLWRDGNPEAARQLEDLWNELATKHRFTLLCGYSMGNFSKEAHGAPFEGVCQQHTRVVPTETYLEAEDDTTKLREIARLQQRAKALEAELAHRRELEAALRQALAEGERAQAQCERLLVRERAARADAEAAGRLKDEFLAVLSHELRTPLNAILGWTQIATDPNTEETTMRRALAVIQRNAKLQLHVTDDLLDVSRILTGKMLVASDPIDLANILNAALDTVRPAAAARDIALSLDVNDAARRVLGDRDRLQQILWNLLSNAIKFTPSGGRVDVRLEREGASARIVVRDTGQGIAPDFLPYVFERFRQADSGTTRRHGGLGLGLAVVRHLVEAHGGTVRVDSAGADQGSTFVVTLPLRLEAVESVVPTGETRVVDLTGARILIVDDDADARELFTYVLGSVGASVESAPTVEQALDVLATGQFELLVADIGMPDRDGLNLIEAIRQHPTASVRIIRTIAVTSYAGEQYRARAIAAGYDQYVSKPVEPQQLTELACDVLRRRRPAPAATS